MKKLLIILTGFFATLSSFGQEGQFAPLNPDFVRYQEYLKTPEGKKSVVDGRLGYVPSPLQLNFANYKGVRSLQSNEGKSITLPSRFDLRDSGFVTSVKDQGAVSTCWAFAAIGSIESNWLVNHWGTYDLSEQNMVACNGINPVYNHGGTNHITSPYITRFAGPVLEEDDPYMQAGECNPEKFPVPRYVLTSRILPADHELIKKTIMEYGAINVGMMVGSDVLFYNNYYNYSDYTFYYNGTSDPNHMVLLVGWDDNKIVTGGALSPKGTKGAWIVKNSWGTNSWVGKNGYFYLSYYDNKALNLVYHFDESTDTASIDKLNMYDDHGASRAFGFNNEVAWGLSRFDAPVKEIIKRVGTFILSACSSIDIEIYEDFSDGNLSGLLYSKKDIICEFPGQRVFDVFAVVEGDYYIKIKYKTPTCFIPIPVEINNSYFLPPLISQIGTSWVSNDGEVWEEIGMGIKDREMDLTIRSYTISAKKCLGYFELPKKQLCFGEPFSVAAEIVDSTADCFWQFLPDGSPMNDSGPGPINAQFNSPGIKKINLIIQSQNWSDTISQSLEVVSNLDFEIYHSFYTPLNYDWLKGPQILRSALDKSIILSVNTDADSFQWNYPYDTINKAEIAVTPAHVGQNLYSVTAYQGACKGSDTIAVEGYGGMFLVSEDTLFLASDSASFAQVIIDADTIWNVTQQATSQNWLGMTNKNYLKRDTVTVFALSDNNTGKIRKSYFTLKGPLMNSKKIIVIQDFGTGLNEVVPASTFTIYPNPATHKISIATTGNLQGETQICIYSINGAKIRGYKFQNTDGFELDVSQLAKGIYLLQLQTNESVETQKLVVQ